MLLVVQRIDDMRLAGPGVRSSFGTLLDLTCHRRCLQEDVAGGRGCMVWVTVIRAEAEV